MKKRLKLLLYAKIGIILSLISGIYVSGVKYKLRNDSEIMN